MTHEKIKVDSTQIDQLRACDTLPKAINLFLQFFKLPLENKQLFKENRFYDSNSEAIREEFKSKSTECGIDYSNNIRRFIVDGLVFRKSDKNDKSTYFFVVMPVFFEETLKNETCPNSVLVAYRDNDQEEERNIYKFAIEENKLIEIFIDYLKGHFLPWYESI